ncbi:helix-turn-helix transcriptional regulator [Hyphomicrobium sulfonivorans]|uniref:helix-turn-helix transcriptional regulator n=1 Tax=Hyphomicrobium sulfonivorans TaxID=121290 RepID=UPI001570AD59|nr:AlpA family transcriptional regulator [Hyphomicrobium sulfonivorans]MBI1650113.1 AlpA family transcriptional regulator [Hyphomicrobium sulfonivorans]NSL73029.1 hypothetical protein [Hyphomicrobium sulfonivorans]
MPSALDEQSQHPANIWAVAARNTSAPPRLIRLKEVARRTGLGRSTIYAMIAVNLFPRQVELTSSRSAWVEAEVDAWIAERMKNRRYQAGIRRTAARRKRKAQAA